MPERPAADLIARVLAELAGVELRDPGEVEALAATYGALVRGIAAFPYAELRRVEPALRSQPGPPAGRS